MSNLFRILCTIVVDTKTWFSAARADMQMTLFLRACARKTAHEVYANVQIIELTAAVVRGKRLSFRHIYLLKCCAGGSGLSASLGVSTKLLYDGPG